MSVKSFLVPVNLWAGAVGSPSLYLGGDTTTGLYRIGANNLGVAVSGAKVLDISSSGLGVSNLTVTGTTKAAGYFDAGAVAPTNVNRLNYDGYLYATRFYGDGSQLTNLPSSSVPSWFLAFAAAHG